MKLEPRSIAEQIECLARLTGAPESFVVQVRELFASKGIPLDSDASPYVTALEEAFRREERIRATAQRAREQVTRLRRDFEQVGRSYVERLAQRPASTLPRPTERTGGASGGQRAVVVRQDSDGLPMVPGPDEPQ